MPNVHNTFPTNIYLIKNSEEIIWDQAVNTTDAAFSQYVKVSKVRKLLLLLEQFQHDMELGSASEETHQSSTARQLHKAIKRMENN